LKNDLNIRITTFNKWNVFIGHIYQVIYVTSSTVHEYKTLVIIMFKVYVLLYYFVAATMLLALDMSSLLIFVQINVV